MRSLLAIVGCFGFVAAHQDQPPKILGIYVDSDGIDWTGPWAKPPRPIVNTVPTKYTHVYASFYLPNNHAPFDFAKVLSDPTSGGAPWLKAAQAAGQKVILSVGGATEPTNFAHYYTDNEPVALAKEISDLVKSIGLDGVDINWEDDWQNDFPGLTSFDPYKRAAASGPAVAWLCNLTQALRAALPADKYELSHAPQPFYFNIGYGEVHKQCGDAIDYYNLQYFNAGDVYSDYTTIFEKASFTAEIPPKPTDLRSKLWDGSVTNLNKTFNVPLSKMVIGKTIAQKDTAANCKWIPVADFKKAIVQGLSKFEIRGVFGWQWGSDKNGSWIDVMSGAFSSLQQTLVV